MALGFYFAPQVPMSASQYDECIRQLKAAGSHNPPGRLYHACFGSPDKVSVFDVWTDQSSFEAFGRTLMPILHKLGVDPGQPSVMAIHNVIVPPAAKPAKKAAKPAAKPAKKKTAKKPAKAKAGRAGKRR